MNTPSDSSLVWDFDPNKREGYGQEAGDDGSRFSQFALDAWRCAAFTAMNFHQPAIMRVRLWNEKDIDGSVQQRREILWRGEVTEVSSIFEQHARESALSVIHLWMSPCVVKRYLETGDSRLARDAHKVANAAANAAYAFYSASTAYAFSSANTVSTAPLAAAAAAEATAAAAAEAISSGYLAHSAASDAATATAYTTVPSAADPSVSPAIAVAYLIHAKRLETTLLAQIEKHNSDLRARQSEDYE